MLGETQPLASKPGSIRGDYSIDLGRNICHGSDSPESAAHELKMWFPEGVNVRLCVCFECVCRIARKFSLISRYAILLFLILQDWAKAVDTWVYE